MKLSHLHSVTTSTFGLLFLGTPHEGMEKAKWYLLSKGVKGILRQHSQLVASMEKNTETLQNITEKFTPLLKQFYIHNFWELRETVHGFSKGYVVSPSSAAPVWENTGRSGLPGTHSEMCKFHCRTDCGFRTICGILQRYANESDRIVSARWTEAKQFLRTQRQYEAREILLFDIHHENKAVHFAWTHQKGSENKHYLVPLTVNRNYTGRQRLACDLQKKMLAPSEQQKRFVIYGVGGSGKTQFCVKFASDNRHG